MRPLLSGYCANVLCELIDSFFNVLFVDVSAIKPVQLIKELSKVNISGFLEIQKHSTSYCVHLQLGVYSLSNSFSEEVSCFWRHFVALLSLFHFISGSNFKRQKSVGYFPESKFAILIRVISSKECSDIRLEKINIHSFKAEEELVGRDSILKGF